MPDGSIRNKADFELFDLTSEEYRGRKQTPRVPKEYTERKEQLAKCSCRVAKAMGYKRIITYILESENGASLKASNFTCGGKAGGTHWTGKRNRGQNIPNEMKTIWYRNLD